MAHTFKLGKEILNDLADLRQKVFDLSSEISGCASGLSMEAEEHRDESERSSMKVKITMTLEVDVDSWRANYGIGMTAEQIRADVKAYVNEAVTQYMRENGLLVAGF